jgi:hypothetical protein
MRTYSPRYTRLVKSYAPIKNPLTELLQIDKPERNAVAAYCKHTGKYYLSDEFYVARGRQDKDPRTLNAKDFRGVCKEIWDEMTRNYKMGFGWKTNHEIENPPATIEFFINDKVTNNA